MSDILQLAGIGAGPFNLSVAALLANQPCRSRFFEAKPRFDWHPGLMLPNALMQTSYLKDLVTPVDPGNPCGFLHYLVAKRRFYDFMNAEQPAVSRQEFADYMAWAAQRLPNLSFNSRVREVIQRGEHFTLRLDNDNVQARRLCVAAGKRPNIPAACKPLLSPSCIHALDIANHDLDVRGKRVAVVGGGQTGAEIMLTLLDGYWGAPRQLSWISRRSNFLPLDETPFSNDWFTPNYVAAFRKLDADSRARLVAEQKLASDGISPITLKALSQRFYQIAHLGQGSSELSLYPGRALESMSRTGGYQLGMRNLFNAEPEFIGADVVILCTGLAEQLPECLGDLRYQLPRDERGKLSLADDFSAALPGQSTGRLYLLNVGRHSHGIAEPQLSLCAWRGACVVNSVLGKSVFDTGQARGVMCWQGIGEAAAAEVA